jgi:hypothetical protein
MKKAKCISKTEKHVYFWSHYFTIGKEYEIILEKGNLLFLRGNDNLFYYVNKDSFEIINE